MSYYVVQTLPSAVIVSKSPKTKPTRSCCSPKKYSRLTIGRIHLSIAVVAPVEGRLRVLLSSAVFFLEGPFRENARRPPRAVTGIFRLDDSAGQQATTVRDAFEYPDVGGGYVVFVQQ